MSVKYKKWPKGKEVLQAGRCDRLEQPIELSTTARSAAWWNYLRWLKAQKFDAAKRVKNNPGHVGYRGEWLAFGKAIKEFDRVRHDLRR